MDFFNIGCNSKDIMSAIETNKFVHDETSW